MNDPARGLNEPDVSEPASRSWSVRGVRLSSRIMAAERAPRGGDWCEAFRLSDDVVALSIGDVCGHGEEKNAAMSATRDAIRDAALAGRDPAGALVAGHRFLRDYDPGEYATAVCGFLHVRTGALTFANAGHPAPLMAHAGHAVFLERPEADLPLGIADAFEPAVHEVTMPQAALLVMYTDGVTEHDRKPLTGAAELHAAAIFAMEFALLPAASVIEKQMFLTGSNLDDAAILTAWMPARREGNAY